MKCGSDIIRIITKRVAAALKNICSEMKYCLIDLDGTLTDPGLGITNSIIYALNKYGINAERSSLYRFIGPPLRETFMDHFFFSREQSEEAVRYYREYFEVKGIFENEVYPGIPGLLDTLCSQGKRLYVATSKPELYAKKIIGHFGLTRFFAGVYGSNMDGSMTSKTEMIAHLIRHAGCAAELTVMIGDRKYDILGARENGLCSVGVKYGYGEPGELEESCPDYIAESVGELTILLAG